MAHVSTEMTSHVQDFLTEGVDLAIPDQPRLQPDAVVKRVTSNSPVCAGSRRYCEKHGTPGDLAHRNWIIFNGFENWLFGGPRGKFSVRVSGNLFFHTVETLLSAVQQGVGIGFHRTSLTGELRPPMS